MKSTGEAMGIDKHFDSALTKALLASGLALPPEGSVLLSIADNDKPDLAPLVRNLQRTNYAIYATEGTAELLKSLGSEVTAIPKKLSVGHPNVVDVIQDSTVDFVVNTSEGGRTTLRDGFHIRRAAAERRIPCFTSIDTALNAVATLVSSSTTYAVEPMDTYTNRNFIDAE